MKVERLNQDFVHFIYPSSSSLGKAFENILNYSSSTKRAKGFLLKGVGISASTLERFFGQGTKLSQAEIQLQLNKCSNPARYFVGTCGDQRDLFHELAHGLWHLYGDYRKKAIEIVRGISDKKKINRLLMLTGYSEENFLDETQAYLIGGINFFNGKGINQSDLLESQRKLHELFNNHCPKSLLN